MRLKAVCAGMLVLALGSVAVAVAAAQGQVLPSWRMPLADVARGAELAENCGACHGAAGEALDPTAPRLRHMRASYIFAALRQYAAGTRQSPLMQPAAEGLSEQDMRDVAQALAGQMFDRPPPVRSDLPGYAISQRQCSFCHGETGIGELEGMPVLTGQDRAYLVAALKAYRAGERGDPTMRDVARGLDDATIEALAGFYSAHQWLERLP